MKIRKSSSLVATGCTLCIAAASGTVAPHAAAAAAALPEQQPTVVSRDVALTASFDPYVIASLPLQNLNQAANAFTAVANGVLLPVNASWVEFGKGNVSAVPGILEKIPANEVTAIANLLNLPAQIIQTDLAAIGLLSQPAEARSNALVAGEQTVSPALASTPDPLEIILGLASLPLQNAITVGNAVGQTLVPINTAWTAFVTGAPNLSATLEAQFQKELAAINALLRLPITITQNNIAYINQLFSGAQMAALRANPLVAEPSANVSVAAASNPLDGFLTIASLPLQNAITVGNAVGQTLVPVNTAWTAFVTGAPNLPATLETQFQKELAAINTLLGLPAQIVNYDVETIRDVLSGGATLQNAEADTFSVKAVEATDESGAAEGSDAGDSVTDEKADETAPAADQQGEKKQQPQEKNRPEVNLDKFGKHAAERLQAALTGSPIKKADEKQTDKQDEKDQKDAAGDKQADKQSDKDKKDAAGDEAGKKDTEKKSGPKHAKPDNDSE